MVLRVFLTICMITTKMETLVSPLLHILVDENILVPSKFPGKRMWFETDGVTKHPNAFNRIAGPFSYDRNVTILEFADDLCLILAMKPCSMTITTWMIWDLFLVYPSSKNDT